MGFRANDSPERKAANLVDCSKNDVYGNLEQKSQLGVHFRQKTESNPASLLKSSE